MQRQLSVSQTRMVLSAETLNSLRPSTSTAHTISSWPCGHEPGTLWAQLLQLHSPVKPQKAPRRASLAHEAVSPRTGLSLGTPGTGDIAPGARRSGSFSLAPDQAGSAARGSPCDPRYRGGRRSAPPTPAFIGARVSQNTTSSCSLSSAKGPSPSPDRACNLRSVSGTASGRHRWAQATGAP